MMICPTLPMYSPEHCLQALYASPEKTKTQCHGTTKANARCKNKITLRNAQAAKGMVVDAMTTSCSAEAIRILSEAAPLMLCKGAHQGQKQKVATLLMKLVPKADIVIKLEPDDEMDDARQASQEGLVKTEYLGPSALIKQEPLGFDHERPSSRLTLHALPEPVFRSYSDQKSSTDLNFSIKRVLSTPLSPKSIKSAHDHRTGCVYAYTFQPSPGRPIQRLKIGYTIDLPRRLIDVEKNCLQKPKVLCKFETKLHQKVERIVHTHLANHRLKMKQPCSGCGSCHQEWFETRLSVAAAVIGLWTDWSLQEPYDGAGRLKPVWQKKLDNLDLSDPCCWDDFVCED